MGRRGPPKTPTTILAARGSWRAKVRSEEPHPECVRPVCPQWLTAEARKIWQLIVPLLAEMKLLGAIDRQALARYCTIYTMWRAAAEIIETLGPTAPAYDKDGNEIGYQDRPEVARMIRLGDQLTRLEGRYGMTPSDRANLAGSANQRSEEPQSAALHYLTVGRGAS